MRPRVLLVPDTPFWITGDIAQEIARHNPGLDCTVLPSKGLKWLAARHPEMLREFDLVHCLTPDLYRKFAPLFGSEVARVTTVFHVETAADTDGVPSCDGLMTASLQWRDALRRDGYATMMSVDETSFSG